VRKLRGNKNKALQAQWSVWLFRKLIAARPLSGEVLGLVAPLTLLGLQSLTIPKDDTF
jgi:hypothetical protein